MNKICKPRKSTIIIFLCFVLIIGIGWTALFHDVWKEIPLIIYLFGGTIYFFALFCPIIMFKAKLVITDDGITQFIPFAKKFYKWNIRWSDVVDWSILEVGFQHGGEFYQWEPYVFLQTTNECYSTHSWIISTQGAKEIANVLSQKCGNPHDPDNPVIHRMFHDAPWKQIK